MTSTAVPTLPRRRRSPWFWVGVGVATVAAPFALVLAVFFLTACAGPRGGVNAATPPTADAVWFEALVADTTSGPCLMDALEPGCMGSYSRRADEGFSTYPTAYTSNRSRRGVLSVVWIDAPRCGLLRKSAPGVWSLTWFPAAAVRRTPRLLESDDIEFDVKRAEPASTPDDAWLRSLGLDKALAWTP